jgi:hypothetical protein
MTKPIGSGDLELRRCPSALSTTAGGLSPLTCTFPGSPFGEISGTDMVACTNVTKVSLQEGLYIDEYLVLGTVDLCVALYDRIITYTRAIRLVFLPSDMGVVVLSVQREYPLGYDSTNWIPQLEFVTSHSRACDCQTCRRCLVFLLRESLSPLVRMGKHEYLPSMLSLVSSIVAYPGLRVRPTLEFSDSRMGVSVSFDSLTKWVNFDNQSSLMAILSKSKSPNNLIGQYVITPYNMRVYRVKTLRYDLSPLDVFYHKKWNRPVRFLDYVLGVYRPQVTHMVASSPLIEVYPENRSEQCFLLPAFTYLVRDEKRPSIPMQTVHAQTRVAPQIRNACISALTPTSNDLIDIRQLNVSVTKIDWPSTVRPPPSIGFSYGIIFDGAVDVSASAARFVSRLSQHKAPATGSVDIVLIIIRNRNSYAKWKWRMLVERGQPCQIVRTDTIVNKPGDIVMTDLVHQMAEKVGTSSSTSRRVIGLDFHRFGDLCVLTAYAHGHTVYRLRHVTGDQMVPEEIAMVYGELIREVAVGGQLMVMFASRRRIPSSQEDFHLVTCISQELKRVLVGEFVFIVCSTKADTRFFLEEPFYAETKFLTPRNGDELDAFYLVPHSAAFGNALPLHYFIACDRGRTSVDEVRETVLGLYPPRTEGERGRMPIPFVHTQKLSELIGIHLKKAFGDKTTKFIETLCVNQHWQRLVESRQPFYL